MGKRRFWLAIAENPRFTADDHHVFKVLFSGQPGDKGFYLSPSFVDADDLASAREKILKAVDEYLGHLGHMDGMHDPAPERRAPPQEAPRQSDSGVRSISIGVFKDDEDKLPGM